MDESLPNPDTALLQRYVDGELNAQEKSALENRLQQNTSLRRQLQNMQLAIQAIKHYGITQQVASIHHEMMEEMKQPQKKKLVSLSTIARYSLTMAASILVIFLAVKLFSGLQNSPEKLYTEAFVDFNLSATRGGVPLSSAIEKHYQQKNFDAVIHATRSGATPKDSLLIGLSYLQTEKPAQALPFFQRLAQGDSNFRQDAEFYLSLSHLKLKNYTETLRWMKKIYNDPAHLYHQQMNEEMLEKVSALSK